MMKTLRESPLRKDDTTAENIEEIRIISFASMNVNKLSKRFTNDYSA